MATAVELFRMFEALLLFGAAVQYPDYEAVTKKCYTDGLRDDLDFYAKYGPVWRGKPTWQTQRETSMCVLMELSLMDSIGTITLDKASWASKETKAMMEEKLIGCGYIGNLAEAPELYIYPSYVFQCILTGTQYDPVNLTEAPKIL